MKCLLWETSSVPWGLGIAELETDKINLLASCEDNGARTLAGDFIHALEQVLDESQCALSDIDALAVSLGPGSWTGLRIGLTAAKTLALSFSLPLVGIATFDIFAEALQEETGSSNLILVQAPCRPGERYAKLWHCQGAECDLQEPEWIGSPCQIAERLQVARHKNNVQKVIIGGPEGQAAELPELGAEVEWRKSTFTQRLQAMARLAASRVKNNNWDDALTLQPIYLAPSAAEREYYAKQQRSS